MTYFVKGHETCYSGRRVDDGGQVEEGQAGADPQESRRDRRRSEGDGGGGCQASSQSLDVSYCQVLAGGEGGATAAR